MGAEMVGGMAVFFYEEDTWPFIVWALFRDRPTICSSVSPQLLLASLERKKNKNISAIFC
jgi:hypothetical protein